MTTKKTAKKDYPLVSKYGKDLYACLCSVSRPGQPLLATHWDEAEVNTIILRVIDACAERGKEAVTAMVKGGESYGRDTARVIYALIKDEKP